ncbi:unnamed protein product, partial [Didymodactylos carnosus]
MIRLKIWISALILFQQINLTKDLTVTEDYQQYDKGSQTVAEIFESPCITLSMNCTISSHTICYVCRSHIDGSSMTIAAEDRDMIFVTKNVMIREGSRCCRKHLEDHRLMPASINIIKPHKIEIISLKAGDVQMLINKSQILYNQKKRLDFDDCNAISDDEYYNLTSLNKGQFDSLIKEIAAFPIRNTAVRSIRTAVVCLLCKLRLGLSNTILALLFESPDKRAVSRAIGTARKAIMKDFVPYHLGISHITRRQIIDNHTTTIARELMGGGNDTLVLVIDGTYIYIQKDVVVVDRGFRDCLGVMYSLGLDVAMPPFLDGQKQFSTAQANRSRCITK